MNRRWFWLTLWLALALGSRLAAATLAEQVARLDDPANVAAVVAAGDAALSALAAELKGPRPDLVVQVLGQLKSPRAVLLLLPLVTDPDGELRAQVAWALGEVGGADAAAGVLKLAADAYPPARAAAVAALVRYPQPEAVAALRAALAAPEGELRLAAVNAIRQADRQEFIADLCGRLDYVVEMVPETAKTPAAAPKLVERVAWQEPDPQVRRAVIRTLAGFRQSDALPALITAMERETSLNRLAIIAALEALGEPAAGACLGRIVPLPCDRETVAQRLPLLLNNGTLAVIAGRLGDDRCVPYLLTTLQLPHEQLGRDPDLTELFLQTIELLGRYRVNRAARPLVALLKESRVRQVSERLQTAILAIGHPAARPLAASLDDWQLAPVFFRLLRAPELRTRAAREAILKYVDHESDEVRLAATETLGLYLYEGELDEYDLPLLDAMYLDPAGEVRAACARWQARCRGKFGPGAAGN